MRYLWLFPIKRDSLLYYGEKSTTLAGLIGGLTSDADARVGFLVGRDFVILFILLIPKSV